MNIFLSDASMLSKMMEEACDKVYGACDICAPRGRSHQSNNISLSNVNEAFNEEIQADYTVVYIKLVKYFVLNIVDSGTRYRERFIDESQDASRMMLMI